MKTHSKIVLSLLLLTGTATMALAGPPPEFWVKRPTPQATAPAQPSPKPPLPDGLTCARMLVPNLGGSKVPYTSVRCTPEMMKNDWRCQQACANAAKAKKG